MIWLTRRHFDEVAAEILRKVAQVAGSQQDLDAALDALDAQLKTSTDAILKAVQDIQGKVGPSVDLSAEISRIQGEAATIKSAGDQVTALDTP